MPSDTIPNTQIELLEKSLSIFEIVYGEYGFKISKDGIYVKKPES